MGLAEALGKLKVQNNSSSNGVEEAVQDDGDDKVTINVGGVRHETMYSTLELFPGTRLAIMAQLKEKDEAYNPQTKEYFFDRHPKAFENILQYYRTEELHIDPSVCGNLMNKELVFWGVDESEIEPCCWAIYSKFTEHKKTLEELDDNFGYKTDFEAWNEDASKWKTFQVKVWRFLEDPQSSRLAKTYAIVSMFFVALSILIFVLETHKMFQVDEETRMGMTEIQPVDAWTPTGSPLTCCCDQDFNQTSAVPVTHPALVYVDYVCLFFFVLELAVRFIFCPEKKRFFKELMNVIDLLCLIPYCVSIALRAIDESSGAAAVLKTFLMMRIVRILRIFKLMKHYSAFKILAYTLKVSTKELFLMVVFLMTGVLMFASLVHYIEKENFPNIPIGIWWALVTMTTVGYGDKYTVTIPGFVVGSLCVISGVLVIAFTVPIVVNNFSLYYSHAQTRLKAPIKRKRGERKLKSRITTIMKQKNIFKNLALLQKGDANSTKTPVTNVNIKKESNDTPKSFDSLPTSSRETSGMTTDDDQKDLIKAQTKKETSVNSKKATLLKKMAGKSTNNTSKKKNDSTYDKTTHGSTSSATDASTSSTSTLNVEDLESLDSGYDEGQAKNNKQYEAETKKIMESMMSKDHKQQEERKRQEWLLNKKRQMRSRLKSKDGTPATPRDTRGLTPRDIEIESSSSENIGSVNLMDEITEESKT